MSDTSRIRQFLVSLGWDIDTAGMNRFASSIAVQTEGVRELGEGLKEAALKVIDFVGGIAQSLDKMYWLSVHTKASVGNLNAMKYAAEQTGGTLDDLAGPLQGLTDLLKKKPGAQNWLAQLHVDASDGRDRLELLLDIVQKLDAAALTSFQKYKFAETFAGLSPTQFDEMRSPDFQKYFDEHKQRAKEQGVDEQQAAAGMKNFEQAMGQLKDQIRLFETGVLGPLLIRALPYIKQFVTFAIVQIGHLIDWWEHLSKQTKTAILWLLGIGTAFSSVAIVLKLAAALFAAFDAPVLLVVAGLTLLTTALTFLPWDEIGKDAEAFIKKMEALAETLSKKVKPALDNLLFDLTPNDGTVRGDGKPFQLNGWEEAKRKIQGALAGDADADSGNGGVGLAINNPFNLKFAGQPGAHQVGQWAGYDSPQEGLNAGARQLGFDVHNHGARTLTDIVNQWLGNDPKESPASHRDYIADLVKSVSAAGIANVSPLGALNFDDPKIVEAVLQGLVHHETGKNPYAPEMYEKSLAAGGFGNQQAGVTIHQDITTTVNGATDPAGVAKTISMSLDKGNGLLVRAFQTRIS